MQVNTMSFGAAARGDNDTTACGPASRRGSPSQRLHSARLPLATAVRRNQRLGVRSQLHAVVPPCTQFDETSVCQLTLHLMEYNRLLQPLSLELREVKIRGVVGRIHLAMTQEDPCYYNRDQQNKRIRRTRAASVLLELLRQHCCIAAIDVNAALARRPHLLKAIAESCPVTSLAVFSCDMKTQEANSVRRLVGSLRHTLQELEINCEADGFENMARRVLAKVVCDSGNFLSMRRLDLTHADMNLFSAEKIIAGLSRNKVIEELAVDSSLFTCGSQRLGEDFTSYLRYAKPNLKKLTIRQSRNCRSRALKSLTATLARMKYLEEVNVYSWTKASVLTEAFSKVARNRSLRTLRIERKTSDMEFMMDDDQSISRWLQSLQTNNTLEELVINLSCFTADDCLLFLVAVAANRNLTRVNVGTIMPRGRVADICELIRGKDLVDRLFIRQWIIGPQDVVALAGLPEVTSVRLCCGRFEVPSTFESAFHVVAACDHVTTLHVDLEELCGDGGYQTAMSDYIGAAAVLKDLTILHLRNNDCQHESQEDCAKARLVKALCSNEGIEKICLKNLGMKRDEVEVFANWVASSRRLHTLSYSHMRSCEYEHLPRCLSRSLVGNYTVVNISIDYGCSSEDAAVIRDITTRNSNMLAQAARFANGHHDTGLVRVFELMARHPLLVERVQEMSSVGADEAATMIRRSLTLRMHYY